MAWIKLDDGFFLHPKAIAAGRDARALFIAAACRANRDDTDGRLDQAAMAAAGQEAGIDSADVARLADRLACLGMLLAVDDGWVINDWDTIKGADKGAQTPHEWWSKRHTEPMPAHWPQATGVA